MPRRSLNLLFPSALAEGLCKELTIKQSKRASRHVSHLIKIVKTQDSPEVSTARYRYLESEDRGLHDLATTHSTDTVLGKGYK